MAHEAETFEGGLTSIRLAHDGFRWVVWREDAGHVGWPTFARFASHAEAKREFDARVSFLRDVQARVGGTA